MALEGLTKGLLYIGHSHVNNESCLHSYEDFESLIIYNAKYSWTINGGFMIVKNSNKPHKLNATKYKNSITKMENIQKETKLYKNTIKKYNQFDGLLREKYNKYARNNKQILKLEKRYNNKNYDDYFREQSKKIQHNYYKKNMHSITRELNKKFNKNEGINVYFEDKINKR